MGAVEYLVEICLSHGFGSGCVAWGSLKEYLGPSLDRLWSHIEERGKLELEATLTWARV
jgi:hypothetical protein